MSIVDNIHGAAGKRGIFHSRLVHFERYQIFFVFVRFVLVSCPASSSPAVPRFGSFADPIRDRSNRSIDHAHSEYESIVLCHKNNTTKPFYELRHALFPHQRTIMLWIRSSALFLLASTAFAVEESLFSSELMTAFHKWADFHGKEYGSHEEKMTRLQIWAENDGKQKELLIWEGKC